MTTAQTFDILDIIYKNEVEPSNYSSTGYRQNRPPDIGNNQISVLYLQQPSVRFYANGGMYDPRSLLYSGYWAYEKIADMVPMDYVANSGLIK